MKKIYNFFNVINEYCYVDNVIYYNKSNIIRAPLEAALSLYLFEFIIVFTDFFLKELPDPKQMLSVVFLPILCAILICVIYSIVIGIFMLIELRRNINKVIKNNTMKFIEKYNKINQNFKTYFIVIHIFGTVCYTLLAFIVALQIKNMLNSPVFSCSCLTFIGFLFGFLWNLMGYYCDLTIDWRNIFIQLHVLRYKRENLIRPKFNCFIKCVVFNLIIIFFIIVSTVCLLIHFQPTPNTKENAEIYYYLITIFLTLLAVYSRQMFKLFYKSKNNEDSIVFPSFKNYFNSWRFKFCLLQLKGGSPGVSFLMYVYVPFKMQLVLARLSLLFFHFVSTVWPPGTG